MHKISYASGFLFHPRSQQILLQQISSENEKPLWSLFSKECPSEQLSEENFKDTFSKIFSLDIKKRNIHMVYSYYSEESGNQQILYAEIRKLQESICENSIYRWFSQRDIARLNIPKQAKHDIIIGFRVIESSTRKKLGQRTID
jgi:hypothetical protein